MDILENSAHKHTLKSVMLHKQIVESSADISKREFVEGQLPFLLVLLSPNIFLR
jgi:hypothetical protein